MKLRDRKNNSELMQKMTRWNRYGDGLIGYADSGTFLNCACRFP